jgi:hypothetical protein
VSVHHYVLAPTATGSGFRDAVAEAVDRGLFESIPGLVEYPDAWRTWEDELLDPLLATDPDEIENTTSDRLADSRADPP